MTLPTLEQLSNYTVMEAFAELYNYIKDEAFVISENPLVVGHTIIIDES